MGPEEKGLKINAQAITDSMGADVARLSTEKAYAVANVLELQKENDRLREVIKELTVEKKDGE